MQAQKFVELCDRDFNYLDGFGFSKADASADLLSWEVKYKSRYTAISIEYSHRDQEIFVRIQPSPEVSGHSEHFNFWYLSFDLQNILVIRAPHIVISPPRRNRPDWHLSESEIIESLDRAADALLHHGRDILEGDFSMFMEVKSLFDTRR